MLPVDDAIGAFAKHLIVTEEDSIDLLYAALVFDLSTIPVVHH